MAKKKTRKGKKATRKKKPLKRKPVRKKKAVPKRTLKRAKKKVAAPRPGPELPAEPIGKVTHYFPKVRASAIMIEREGIRVGDVLYFKGHTTHFKQAVESLQVNHQAVSQAGPGDEVGIRVKRRTRERDLVFRL